MNCNLVPDFNFSGCLSSLCASLDYSQYCFILGMLGENFGEPLEEFERPSSVIQDPLGKVIIILITLIFSTFKTEKFTLSVYFEVEVVLGFSFFLISL